MSKPKIAYTVELLNGEVHAFTSTMDLAWAVVVEDSKDRSHNPSRHGIYAKSASREAASKKAAEARSITGEYAFARVEVRPIVKG